MRTDASPKMRAKLVRARTPEILCRKRWRWGRALTCYFAPPNIATSFVFSPTTVRGHEKTDFYQVFGNRRNRGSGWRSARLCRSSQNEDHAGASLPAAKSQPAIQSERCGGHYRDRRRNHRHRRRRLEGYAVPVRGQIDRQGSAAYRTALAGHEPVLLLSGGAREDACHRRA